MNTYNKKAISELDEATIISNNDILLVSQFNDNGQLISKKMQAQTLLSNCVKILQDENNKSAHIYGGNILSNGGAELILNGKDNATGNGVLYLVANNSIHKTKLTLEPDGDFYLQTDNTSDKTHIVRTVNNRPADSDGNIAILSVESSNKLNNPITITLSGDLSGSVAFDGSSNVNLGAYITNVTNVSALAFKDKILSSDLEGQLSVSQIAGLKSLAFKDKILSSDINGKLSASQIEGLKELVFKDKILSSDIGGQLSVSQIAGLKKLAFKDKILSSDIEGKLSVSQIAGLKTELDSKINSVTITSKLEVGTEIATIEVDGEQTTLYAPEGSDVKGGVTNIGIGSVIAFAGENIPDNTLLCDGSEVSKTDYEALWLVIGDRYGQASDSSKFKLPNLNERFIEGISSDLSVGQYLEAGLPNITGQFGPGSYLATGTAIGAFSALDNSAHKDNDSFAGSGKSGFDFDASRSNEIYGKSDTVQPAAVLMKYVIVYKQLEGGNVIINTEGGSGCVIDGTFLEKNTYSNLSGNPFKYSYTVKNDCLLAINGKYTAPNNSVQSIKINGNIIVEYRDPNGITNDEYPINFPVKKGSVVDIENTHNMSNVELTFTEFKLNPLNVTHTECTGSGGVIDGTVLSHTEPTTLAIPKTGSEPCEIYTTKNNCLLVIRISSDASGVNDINIMVNDKNSKYSLYKMPDAGAWGVHILHVPIKANTKLYACADTSTISRNIPFEFTEYKLHSLNQEVPSNCASYVVESGRFNSSDGTTHENNSENDSWYRLYSDGWCEQGGYLNNQTFNETTCSVQLHNQYNNAQYNIYTEIQIADNAEIGIINCYIKQKLENQFNIYKDYAYSTVDNCSIYWEAKGFIN